MRKRQIRKYKTNCQFRTLIINQNSNIMEKKSIMGIVSGVAAVVVIGIIAKKSGVLESVMEKIKCLIDGEEDCGFDKKNTGDILPKGEDSNISYKHLLKDSK